LETPNPANPYLIDALTTWYDAERMMHLHRCHVHAKLQKNAAQKMFECDDDCVEDDQETLGFCPEHEALAQELKPYWRDDEKNRFVYSVSGCCWDVAFKLPGHHRHELRFFGLGPNDLQSPMPSNTERPDLRSHHARDRPAQCCR